MVRRYHDEWQNASNSQIKRFKLTLWKVQMCATHTHIYENEFTFYSLPSLLSHSLTLKSYVFPYVNLSRALVQLFKMLLLFCFIISPLNIFIDEFCRVKKKRQSCVKARRASLLYTVMLKCFFSTRVHNRFERKIMQSKPNENTRNRSLFLILNNLCASNAMYISFRFLLLWL